LEPKILGRSGKPAYLKQSYSQGEVFQHGRGKIKDIISRNVRLKTKYTPGKKGQYYVQQQLQLQPQTQLQQHGRGMLRKTPYRSEMTSWYQTPRYDTGIYGSVGTQRIGLGMQGMGMMAAGSSSLPGALGMTSVGLSNYWRPQAQQNKIASITSSIPSFSTPSLTSSSHAYNTPVAEHVIQPTTPVVPGPTPPEITETTISEKSSPQIFVFPFLPPPTDKSSHLGANARYGAFGGSGYYEKEHAVPNVWSSKGGQWANKPPRPSGKSKQYKPKLKTQKHTKSIKLKKSRRK